DPQGHYGECGNKFPERRLAARDGRAPDGARRVSTRPATASSRCASLAVPDRIMRGFPSRWLEVRSALAVVETGNDMMHPWGHGERLQIVAAHVGRRRGFVGFGPEVTAPNRALEHRHHVGTTIAVRIVDDAVRPAV